MISVSTLTSYLYCRRKLFLQKVLGLVEVPKEAILKGQIKHDSFDNINKAEPLIVKSFTAKKTSDEIKEAYINRFSRIFRDNIIRKKAELANFNIPLTDFFRKNWPLFLEEAKERAENVFNFMRKNNVYGDELWLRLTPKIKSEFSIASEKLDLIGRIDMLKIFDDSVIPYELKTGYSPNDGAWKEHKLQLGAYMLMLKDKGHKTEKGYIKYVDENKEITVNLDPFLESEVINLNQEVKSFLKSNHLPDKAENPNKCKSCGLRDKCFDEALMQQKISELV